MFFVRESKYASLKEKYDALNCELAFTKQLLLVEQAASKNYRIASLSEGKTTIKECPKALVVPNRAAVSFKATRTVNNDYVTPAEPAKHVVFLGDTFSPSMLDSSFVGSGGSFGGGGASASWSDDSCSKSYGGTDVSDVNSCSSTDSNISSSQ